jgi:hypothetical protein
MQVHRNAKLGLAGRFALVKTIEAGCSCREAARRHPLVRLGDRSRTREYRPRGR